MSKLATPAADIGRPGSARRSTLRLAPAQYLSPDPRPDPAAAAGSASAGTSVPAPPLPLGRYEPRACWKGVGPVTIVAGPRAQLDLLAPELLKLGWHWKPLAKDAQGKPTRWCLWMPLSRWRGEGCEPEGARLAEFVRLATDYALSCHGGLQLSISRMREMALELKNFHHRDTKAPSPEEKKCPER